MPGTTAMVTFKSEKSVVKFEVWLLPAVRFGLQHAEFVELRAQELHAFLGGGGQRRTGGTDRTAHVDHGALQRRRILLLEHAIHLQNNKLAFARSFPVARFHRSEKTIT